VRGAPQQEEEEESMPIDYVARVRALLALAENAGSEHEAEVARQRAMEISFRHNISDAMVGVLTETPTRSGR
jgi:hypothetical protein